MLFDSSFRLQARWSIASHLGSGMVNSVSPSSRPVVSYMYACCMLGAYELDCIAFFDSPGCRHIHAYQLMSALVCASTGESGQV